MRTVEDQLQVMLAAVKRLEPLDLPLLDALGCVLAVDVTTAHPIPAFVNAAHAGFAGRTIDLSDATVDRPTVLSVADRVPSGFRSEGPLPPRSLVAVAAGAMLPQGADVVLTTASGSGAEASLAQSTVSIAYPSAAGLGVRQIACDVDQGTCVVTAGTPLAEREVAAVVAAGSGRVLVHPRPRVAVVSVGNELVEAGARLEPGLVHDVGGVTLVAAAVNAGASAYRGGPAPESAAAIAACIEDQLVRADLVVVIGGIGAAVGQAIGSVQAALTELGQVDFGLIAVDGVTEIGFGTIGDDSVPVVCLPGDPAAAMIAFEVFVRPLIRLLAGRTEIFRPVVRATLTSGVAATAGARRFVPAVLSANQSPQGRQVEPLSARRPESVVWFHAANALAIVEERDLELLAGDEVAVIWLDRE